MQVRKQTIMKCKCYNTRKYAYLPILTLGWMFGVVK
jgi:hypothetical protein